MKSYSKMMSYKTFEERCDYLKLFGVIGASTFGGYRYLNQSFYQSQEWRQLRNKIILRDSGCDLAIPDRFIRGKIYIHHINPITVDDIIQMRSCVMDPDNLVCVSFAVHNAIHFANDSNIQDLLPTERFDGDTCLWR